MLLNKKLAVAVVACFASVGAQAQAAPVTVGTGSVSFTGTVTSATCTVTAGNTATAGNPGGVVALPIVSINDVPSTASASTVFGTSFNVVLTNCQGFGAGQGVSVLFGDGHTNVATSGNVKNTVSGGTNVEVAIFDLSGAATTPLNLLNPRAGLTSVVPVSNAVTLKYFASYVRSNGAAATAGTFSAPITLGLTY